MVGAGDRAGDVSGDRAEEAVAEEEHEGGRAVHDALRDQAPATAKTVPPIVPGAGFAADRQQDAITRAVSAAQARRRPFGYDAHQRLPHGPGDLRSKNPLGLRLERHLGLVGRVRREMQALQIDVGLPDAIIQNDAHQIGERVRTVARAADGAAV